MRNELELITEVRKAQEERRKELFDQARHLHDTIVELKEKVCSKLPYYMNINLGRILCTLIDYEYVFVVYKTT